MAEAGLPWSRKRSPGCFDGCKNVSKTNPNFLKKTTPLSNGFWLPQASSVSPFNPIRQAKMQMFHPSGSNLRAGQPSGTIGQDAFPHNLCRFITDSRDSAFDARDAFLDDDPLDEDGPVEVVPFPHQPPLLHLCASCSLAAQCVCLCHEQKGSGAVVCFCNICAVLSLRYFSIVSSRSLSGTLRYIICFADANPFHCCQIPWQNLRYIFATCRHRPCREGFLSWNMLQILAHVLGNTQQYAMQQPMLLVFVSHCRK